MDSTHFRFDLAVAVLIHHLAPLETPDSRLAPSSASQQRICWDMYAGVAHVRKGIDLDWGMSWRQIAPWGRKREGEIVAVSLVMRVGCRQSVSLADRLDYSDDEEDEPVDLETELNQAQPSRLPWAHLGSSDRD